MRKNAPITYNITDEEIQYVQSHTLNFLYDNTIYWVFSENMAMYYPFLLEKKKAHISLDELLSYCHNQRIGIYPMTLRKNKPLTKIAMRIAVFKMNNLGLMIGSAKMIRLINEYAKYCLVKYPIHIEMH